jgi:actin-related protein
MFKGLAERLKSELMKLAPEGTEINVISSPKLKYGSWYGAAIIIGWYWVAEEWITR